MKKFLTNSFVFIMISFISLSCQKKGSNLCHKKHLSMGFNANPKTVDPRKNGDLLSSCLIFLVFDGLTRSLPDGSVVGSLADSYEVSQDKKKYTFHIRDNAFWSDGVPITAEDFVYTWKTALDPSFPCLCASLFAPIKNAEKISRRELPVDSLAVFAKDAKTLVVELENPAPYFLHLVGFCNLFAVPKHFVEKHENWENSKETFPCSGPFIIDTYRENELILVKKNQSHWKQEVVELEEIKIPILYDPNTAFQMYERGELDWIGTATCPIPQEIIPRVMHRAEYFSQPMAATCFISFNTQKPPFNNPNIRKAFSYALDRDTLVKKVTKGKEIPGTRCIPPALMKGENRQIVPDNNEELAKQFLEKGLKELSMTPADFGKFELVCGAHAGKSVIEALQNRWKQVLGISLLINQLDYSSCMEKLHSKNFDIAIGGWSAQLADPINILDRFKYRMNPKNYPNWENKKFIDLLDASSEAASSEKRMQILEEAEKLFMEELPLAPVYHSDCGYLLKPHATNMEIAPNGELRFDFMKIGPHEH